ncbi:MAG TPA: hypothetical protein VMK12_30715 [Anaeromyxobacteraceae bacterium]|nr:hypothetical protein [Anaeromyxobacteraceae bacterium]
MRERLSPIPRPRDIEECRQRIADVIRVRLKKRLRADAPVEDVAREIAESVVTFSSMRLGVPDTPGTIAKEAARVRALVGELRAALDPANNSDLLGAVFEAGYHRFGSGKTVDAVLSGLDRLFADVGGRLRVKARRKRSADFILHVFTRSLAEAYQRLTGKFPPVGHGEGPWTDFVGGVFHAVGLAAEPANYASAAAKLLRGPDRGATLKEKAGL